MRLRREGTRQRTRAIRIAGGGLVLLLALVSLLAFGAWRAIVGPVNRLQLYARELGAGRFDTRLPETGPPETAELAHAFNLSAEALQRSTDRHLAELDAVFRDSPIGIAFLDLELRFLRVNEALARNESGARRRSSGTNRRGGHRPARCRAPRCARSSRPGNRCSTSTSRSTAAASRRATSPVRDDRGELLAVGKAMIDVTARRHAESARRRLQDATSALASAVTVADVAGWRSSRRARGARRRGCRAAARSTPSRGQLEIISDRASPTARAGAGARSRWRSRCPPPTPRAPPTAVFISDEATLLERYPGLAGRGRTRVRAPTRRCRSSRTGARSACSRSALPARSTFDTDERGLLNALAAQTAIAIARAQLYEREHTVAQTLQASLLPPRAAGDPGLGPRRALPGGGRQGVEVGGDFYDAFAIGDDRWALAIGDVCGKGVDAAALTALARHTVRAAARAATTRPRRAAQALNRAVLDESSTGPVPAPRSSPA